jgi:H+/gluconate symporter-like permease
MPALLVIAAAIAVLVALVVWAKVHPFLAFVLVSAAAAVPLGMPAGDVAGARASATSSARSRS